MKGRNDVHIRSSCGVVSVACKRGTRCVGCHGAFLWNLLYSLGQNLMAKGKGNSIKKGIENSGTGVNGRTWRSQRQRERSSLSCRIYSDLSYRIKVLLCKLAMLEIRVRFSVVALLHVLIGDPRSDV